MSTRTVILSVLATAAITAGLVETYHAFQNKPQPKKLEKSETKNHILRN